MFFFVWNTESIGMESGIQSLESGIHGAESGIQDPLGFLYMGRIVCLFCADALPINQKSVIALLSS